KTPDLSTPAGMVAGLKHDNMRWRLHAQRLLVERGNKDVVPELLKIIGDNSVDEIGLNAGAIHALWTLHGLKAVEERVNVALKHPPAGARRNAALVANDAKAIIPLLTDADAQVQLAALLALADKPASDPAGTAIGKLAAPSDQWLR